MKLSIRFFLIAMTLVAVISDSLLHPFYPQFFEVAFGVTDPKQVGYYFSAICFMVMISFPFWAMVARKTPELKILVYTQLIAGILALCCVYNTSYVGFWAISLTMILFKGSYLLMYPFILRVSDKEGQVNTIGLLSVIVHFGSILGALAGGSIVGLMNPRYIFFVMAAGDFVQMSTSLYLLKTKKAEIGETVPQEASNGKHPLIPSEFVLKLGMITLVLYFSYFMISPFFSRYWESISAYKSPMVSGAVYAIPGVVAVFALWINHKLKKDEDNFKGIVPAMLLGCVGLILQASPQDWVVIIGRIVYGWAIFQAMVRFDAILFQLSKPEDYATDYSKVHFFQNLGVLLASFSAGILVNKHGLQIPFIVALGGFILTLALYVFIFKLNYTRKAVANS